MEGPTCQIKLFWQHDSFIPIIHLLFHSVSYCSDKKREMSLLHMVSYRKNFSLSPSPIFCFIYRSDYPKNKRTFNSIFTRVKLIDIFSDKYIEPFSDDLLCTSSILLKGDPHISIPTCFLENKLNYLIPHYYFLLSKSFTYSQMFPIFLVNFCKTIFFCP